MSRRNLAIVCLSIVFGIFAIAAVGKYAPRIAEKIKIRQRESAKRKIGREISAGRFQQARAILRKSNLTDDDKLYYGTLSKDHGVVRSVLEKSSLTDDDKLRYGMGAEDYGLVRSILDKSSLGPNRKFAYAVQMKDTHFAESLLQDSSINTDKYLRTCK